jgi:hypothetical protein
VTDLVTDWVTGAHPNHGLIIVVPYGSSENTFVSSNSGVAGERPKLTVTYACECGGGAAGARIVQPGPGGEDTFLMSGGQASSNYGSSAILQVTESTQQKHTLIRFDLSGMPPGAVLSAALLELNLQSVATVGTYATYVHQVTTDWVESQANWNTPAGGPPWTTPGGDYDPTPVASADVDNTLPGPVTWDITPLVAGWIDGSVPNYGLLLTGTSPVNNVTFTSSDSPTTANRPKLTLTYSCPCGTTCNWGGSRLLMVVVNPAELTIQETLKKVRIESWGYTVELIDVFAPQAEFDAAAARNDVAFITEDVLSTDLGTKLTGAAIGVVTEESALSDEFGLAASVVWTSGASLDVKDNVHYITSPFALEPVTVLAVASPLVVVAGTLAPDLQLLGGVGSDPALVAIPAGGALIEGGVASGRRVQLPWGDGAFDLNNLTADGETLMRRALEWGAGAGDDSGAPPPTALSASADAYGDEFAATTPNGALNQFIVKAQGGKRRQAVVRFDTSSIAPFTLVNSATLRLWVRDNRSTNSAAVIDVYKVTEAWTEAAESWLNRTGDFAWSTPGGTHGETVLATATLPAGVKLVWLEWDITALVQEWVDFPELNYGVLLKTDVSKDIKFSSKEATEPADHPQLVVVVQP